MSSLYILAGASCSGKSTLLEQWITGSIDLFEDPCAMNLHRHTPPPKRDRIPQLDFHQLSKAAENSCRLDDCIIHLDLSTFFKHEFGFKESDGWKKLLTPYYEAESIPGTAVIKAFWKFRFNEKLVKLLIQNSFSSCVITTILCKYEDAMQRKIQRDGSKLQAQNVYTPRRHAVFEKLYSGTPLARKNYADHYSGWVQFANRFNALPVQHLVRRGDSLNKESGQITLATSHRSRD